MGPSDPGEGTVINTFILQRLRVNSLEVWSKVRRPAQGPAPHLPDDLWPIVASDMGFQGQFCPSSFISTVLPARREWEGEQEREVSSTPEPLLQRPFPSLLPTHHCQEPSAREETSQLITGDQGWAPWRCGQGMG